MGRTPRRRDGKGRFFTPPALVDRALRAANLRDDGKTWQEISDLLGFGGKSAARQAVEALYAKRIAENEETLRQLRARDLAKLELAEESVWDVLDRRHVTVSNGKVIYIGPDPLLDDGPVLQAVDRLNAIIDRRAKLTGTYAAQQIEAQVTTVDPADVEFREHIAAQRALRQAAREQEETQPDDPAPGADTG
jgi:hypothetical protein